MPEITPGLLSIDYEDAIARSNELKNLAEDCKSVAQSTDKIISALEAAWKGEGGQEVLNYFNGWKKQETGIAEKMQVTAGQIKMVADSIKQADEEAAKRNRG